VRVLVGSGKTRGFNGVGVRMGFGKKGPGYGITDGAVGEVFGLGYVVLGMGSHGVSKSNGPNSISKDALRNEGCPWLINCTTQEYLVNVGQDSHFNSLIVENKGD
jgi:hypothetical protein